MKTVELDGDELSLLRLYLSLCSMYYFGRKGGDSSDLEERFADEHLMNIKRLTAKFEEEG